MAVDPQTDRLAQGSKARASCRHWLAWLADHRSGFARDWLRETCSRQRLRQLRWPGARRRRVAASLSACGFSYDQLRFRSITTSTNRTESYATPAIEIMAAPPPARD